jgi:hypothetical protein
VTTSNAIAAITDRGSFELMANAVLRRKYPIFQHLISTGINANGEPIKDPMDGVGTVPGSNPPHYVSVAHTTTDARGLKAKMLEDLEKMALQFRPLRSSVPSAKFTLALTTNENIRSEWATEVILNARNHGIDVIFLDQSQLADFLDHDPDGQWLRKSYLGIEAERLSAELLRRLSVRSLERYADKLEYNAATTISRGKLDINAENGSHLVLLVGRSGFGKSTMCLQALTTNLDQGGLSFWLPVDAITESASFSDALGLVLKRLHPHLNSSAAEDALRLIAGQIVHIAVDDINSATNPAACVQIVQNWVKAFQPARSSSTGPQLLAQRVAFLCPVWQATLETLDTDPKRTTVPWLRYEFIEVFSDAEARAAIERHVAHAGVDMTPTEAGETAQRLGFDPYLIGLYGERLLSDSSRDIVLGSLDVETYINDKLGQLAAQPARSLKTEYRGSLKHLGRQMLLHRSLKPTWAEITGWFDSTSLVPLRDLTRDGRLCYLDDNEPPRLHFRHDRLGEVVFALAIADFFADPDTHASAISDPFFAAYVGRAIAMHPELDTHLSWLVARQPLVVAEAMRFMQGRLDGFDRYSEAANVLAEWIATRDGSLDADTKLSTVLDSLSTQDSLEIRRIAEELLDEYHFDRRVYYAGLRNGSAMAGVLAFNWSPSYGFWVTDPLRDAALEVGMRRHAQTIIADLVAILVREDTDLELRKSALSFAGYVASSELLEAISSCWSLSNRNTELLPEALWATLRCYSSVGANLFEDLARAWNDESADANSTGLSRQNRFHNALQGALSRGIPNAAVHVLEQARLRYPSLSWLILQILAVLNDGDALEYAVRATALVVREQRREHGYLTFVLTRSWGKNHFDSPRFMTASAKQRLQVIWSQDKELPEERRVAFSFWSAQTTVDDIAVLQGISKDSMFHRRAVIARCDLGDCSVTSDAIEILRSEEYPSMFQHFEAIWSAEIIEVVREYLRRIAQEAPSDYSKPGYDISRPLQMLLLSVNVQDVETLLDEFWFGLRFYPHFVQVALCLSSPRTRHLADEAISSWDLRMSNPLDGLTHESLGYKSVGWQQRLTTEKILSVLPYAGIFSRLEANFFAEACADFQLLTDARNAIFARLDELGRNRHYPTESVLHTELDELLNRKQPYAAEFWIERLKRRGLLGHAPKILSSWYMRHRSVEAFDVLAYSVIALSSRRFLYLLDVESDGDSIRVHNLRKRAVYVIQRVSLE